MRTRCIASLAVLAILVSACLSVQHAPKDLSEEAAIRDAQRDFGAGHIRVYWVCSFYKNMLGAPEGQGLRETQLITGRPEGFRYGRVYNSEMLRLIDAHPKAHK